MINSFTIFPALDLRNGALVRLQEGDPSRQTQYATDPVKTAETWFQAGAKWLHVVNLDGAFGETDAANRKALDGILRVAAHYQGQVQFGGGLRTQAAIGSALEAGVTRVVLGTAAIEHPELLAGWVARFGAERIAGGLDSRDGKIRIHGWQSTTQLSIEDAAAKFHQAGLKWLVFTDISRDGMQTGLNVSATQSLAISTGLSVIASGGVGSWADIRAAARAGLAGVIVGKALYEGVFDPRALFAFTGDQHAH